MESIKELREICQTTRPSIFSDFLSRFYYRVAIYFTWVCLFLGLSANQVTILSGVFAIIGGLLIASNNYFLLAIGSICFHLFAILDMSDGEVARYRKQGGVSGHFLDWYMHFISSSFFMLGLFLSSYPYLENKFLLLIGLMAVIFPILDKSVQTSGWTVICWTKLRDMKKKSLPDFLNYKMEEIKHTNNFLKRRLKFMILAPLQDHWAPLILVILVMIDGVLRLVNVNVSMYYKLLWLLYVGVMCPPYLYSRVKTMVQNGALMRGYQKISDQSGSIEFPRDDFLE